MTPEQQMDDAIARYELAKVNGTLDKEFPVIGNIKPHTCSPDKAFVKVVERGVSRGADLHQGYIGEFIQTICPVDGKIISEVEIR